MKTITDEFDFEAQFNRYYKEYSEDQLVERLKRYFREDYLIAYVLKSEHINLKGQLMQFNKKDLDEAFKDARQYINNIMSDFPLLPEDEYLESKLELIETYPLYDLVYHFSAYTVKGAYEYTNSEEDFEIDLITFESNYYKTKAEALDALKRRTKDFPEEEHLLHIGQFNKKEKWIEETLTLGDVFMMSPHEYAKKYQNGQFKRLGQEGKLEGLSDENHYK